MLQDFHISAKAAIANGADVLLLRNGDIIDLPGGRVEEGETPKAALLRELSEELPDITDVKVGSLIGWHQYEAYPIAARRLMVMIFKVEAHLPDPIRLSDEHETAEWVTWPDFRIAMNRFDVSWTG